MTTAQKILVTAGLAVAVAGGLYQASVIREQRARIRALEGAAKALEQERDTARRELAAAGREIRATDETLGEAELLLADAAQALAAGEAMAQPELLAWVERTKSLKEWSARMPERTIPEMSLLTETDWLEAARKADLSTEAGVREALAELRLIAKKHFRPKLEQALKNYLAANGNRPPADISRLASYFESPVEPAFLERYTIGRSGGAGTGIPVNLDGGLEIWERSEALVDDEHEWRIFTRADGGWGHGPWDRASDIVNNAMSAYRAANGGNQPGDPHQLIPFLPDPNDAAVLREIDERARAKEP